MKHASLKCPLCCCCYCCGRGMDGELCKHFLSHRRRLFFFRRICLAADVLLFIFPDIFLCLSPYFILVLGKFNSSIQVQQGVEYKCSQIKRRRWSVSPLSMSGHQSGEHCINYLVHLPSLTSSTLKSISLSQQPLCKSLTTVLMVLLLLMS